MGFDCIWLSVYELDLSSDWVSFDERRAVAVNQLNLYFYRHTSDLLSGKQNVCILAWKQITINYSL